MTQTSVLNNLEYLIGRAPQDYTNVSIIAAEAALDPEVVVLSQLNRAKSDLNTSISNEATARQNADLALQNSLQSQITTLNTRFQDITNGIAKNITVAARVTDADLQSTTPLTAPTGGIPGVTVNDSADNKGWVLVDGSDTSKNGIYFIDANGLLQRVPLFTTAASLPAGTQVFIDGGTYSNTLWMLPNGATSVTDSSGRESINLLAVEPWVSPADLLIDSNADSQFLSRNQRHLRAQIDANYFTVNAGTLTWTNALQSWKSTNDSNVQSLLSSDTTQNTQLTSLGNTVTSQGNSINSLQSTVTTQGNSIQSLNTSLSSVTSDVSKLKTDDAAGKAALASISASIDNINSTNSLQDSALTGLQQLATTARNTNNTQDAAISALQTAATTALSTNNTQDTAISALQSAATTALNTNNSQDTAIAALQSSVSTINAKNTTQDGQITSLQTTASALQTAVDTKLTAAQVAAQVLAWSQASAPLVLLTNGVTTQVGNYYVTAFTVDLSSFIAILGNTAVYREVSVNEAATPYTEVSKPIFTYTGNRVVAKFTATSAVPDNTIEVAFAAFFRPAT